MLNQDGPPRGLYDGCLDCESIALWKSWCNIWGMIVPFGTIAGSCAMTVIAAGDIDCDEEPGLDVELPETDLV